MAVQKRDRLVSPVLMWVIIVIGWIILWNLIPKGYFYRQSIVGWLVFGIAAINWIYFFIGVLLVHRQVAQSAGLIRKLVVTGVYAQVRHPIYSADLILAWGIFIAWPQYRILAMVVWATIIFTVWMNLEERVLRRKFPGYKKYAEKVPMVIPHYIQHQNKLQTRK
jgi:protein-S-isoprenylcysteine O-methyltransferase Ste14